MRLTATVRCSTSISGVKGAIMDFDGATFRPEWIAMPGYLGCTRLLKLGPGWRGAFGRLDVVAPDTAEDFLQAPAEAIARRVKAGDFKAEDFTELAMMFATVMVLGDRERRDEERRFR